ncbi:hypothetical protein N9O46_00775 [Candidatus Pelagibacter ubique]|jgi:hypothetical protein|nr:hypothetical protein [Candidatus Pelagibacter ubique]MDC1055067.1 DUF5672 family protein [Candidatus Pelagibacter ubique]
MIQLNCQKFLNQYLDKKIFIKDNKDSKNTMLIIDTRLSLNLILVIKNALHKLPHFNLMVISTKNNLEYLESIFGKITHKALLNKSKINLNEYSEILRNQELWKKIPGERVLVFQSDTIFLRGINNNEFQDLSMIGPVCVNFEDDKKFIINGGFSFRNKKLMIELSKNKIINSHIEDYFFTEQLRKYYPELMPNIQDCNNFAIESIGNKLLAKGIHGTDKYYTSNRFYNELFNIIDIEQ